MLDKALARRRVTVGDEVRRRERGGRCAFRGRSEAVRVSSQTRSMKGSLRAGRVFDGALSRGPGLRIRSHRHEVSGRSDGEVSRTGSGRRSHEP